MAQPRQEPQRQQQPLALLGVLLPEVPLKFRDEHRLEAKVVALQDGARQEASYPHEPGAVAKVSSATRL